MGGPAIVTLRPGVQFTPAAGASFRRLEADLGRQVDVNSTYRPWDTQMGMHLAWTAYANGRGPKPWHSRAVHPKYSIHCQGNALDSDDWTTPGFVALAAEHGWIRTAASDPTERHHFEYQSWRDQHINEPAPAGGSEDDMPLNADTDYAAFSAMLQRALRFDVRPNGVGADWKLGPTLWERLNGIEAAAKAGVSIDAGDVAKAVADAIPDNLAAEVVTELRKRLTE